MNNFIRKSFTLIELLVVIAIIGILSGLIIVGMNGMSQKATIAKVQIFSNSLRNSLMLNIVGEWKFDGSGVIDGGYATSTYTQDTWNGGISGTIHGTPLVYSGSNCINGSCLFFNGSSDYITYTPIHFNDLSPYTYSAWVKWGAAAPAATSPFGASYCSSNVWFYVGLNFAHRAYGSGSSQTITGSNIGVVFNNNWHNIVWTVDSSRNMKLFVDGIQNGNTTVISTTTEAYYSSIGAGYHCSSPNYLWNGYIDEVRVFNAPLPTSQIKEQYYAGLNRLLANGGITKEEYIERSFVLALGN
ncbi:MAG: LamG domain-containing protein [Candidatus Paceibacterota bacterium]|jgi:prepilin-type N-terminal cleavage/methylation domain-containing protein